MNADIEIWLSLKTDFFKSKNRNSDRKKSPKPQTSKVRLLRNRNFREYMLPFAEILTFVSLLLGINLDGC